MSRGETSARIDGNDNYVVIKAGKLVRTAGTPCPTKCPLLTHCSNGTGSGRRDYHV